jgi:diguanylate cyclase (GGDEF)-like protein/PAS domain S-box-containing protein
MCLVTVPANALDAINVPLDVDALDLTRAVDRFVEVGDRLQVSTAPGPDGIVRRIEVRARELDGVGNWVVFALSNTSDEQIDRLLVAPHFRLADSRIFWPDLGASRIVAVSPSQGLAPERLDSQEADVFRITLDPGAVVTYVVELRAESLPQLILWDEDTYRDSVNATTLYKGIVLGIAGLLALFLSILFIVKRSPMFPAVAVVAWAVLAYLAIEFGFWNQIFDLKPGEEQVSRAIAEVVLAAALVILVYAYLSLGSVHKAFFQIGLVWAAFFATLIGLAVYEPQIASGIARLGLGIIGVGGLLVILPMSVQGFDRAVHLIPSWIVFLGWLLAAWLAVSGNIVNDFVSPALSGGLVLIVLLLGFTVMQHAFAGGTLSEGLVSDSERKMLALGGSGDLIWDWDLARDRVYSSPATEDLLGLKRGSLAGPFKDWLAAIHPGERDHFRHVVELIVETGRGRIDQTLRMKAEDGHFRWFRLRARPVVGEDDIVFRLIGTMLDVTDMKTTQERLLRDAVRDSLTGLPNRELFLDRVESAIERARMEEIARPTLIMVNIDHFSQHNEQLGVSAADSLLTMVARRIDRLLKPHDTLSRISGDQFGVLLLSQQNPPAIAKLTEQIRRALRTPVVFGEEEVNLTVSIGVSTYDPNAESAEDVLKDAEIAMAHAKRLGGDRCEAFRPSLREHGRSLVAVEADLRKALERDELAVYYQPIIRLHDRTLAGFEALLRWNHPRHGRMAPAEFVPIAERSGLIIPVGLFVMERAARDLNSWMQADANAAGLFTSVNISSRQLLRHDLLNDLRAILTRADLPGSALKLELTESLVMENPEYAAQVLARCRELGIGLSLDDFGTGYSSLSYLQRFPFDTIKIDQSFVKPMVPGEPAVVLGAIVTLGHDLDMDIVAEGIENEEAVHALASLGCEFGQGFHFSHPIPAAAVPAFLQSYAQEQALQAQAQGTQYQKDVAKAEEHASQPKQQQSTAPQHPAAPVPDHNIVDRGRDTRSQPSGNQMPPASAQSSEGPKRPVLPPAVLPSTGTQSEPVEETAPVPATRNPTTTATPPPLAVAASNAQPADFEPKPLESGSSAASISATLDEEETPNWMTPEPDVKALEEELADALAEDKTDPKEESSQDVETSHSKDAPTFDDELRGDGEFDEIKEPKKPASKTRLEREETQEQRERRERARAATTKRFERFKAPSFERVTTLSADKDGTASSNGGDPENKPARSSKSKRASGRDGNSDGKAEKKANKKRRSDQDAEDTDPPKSSDAPPSDKPELEQASAGK